MTARDTQMVRDQKTFENHCPTVTQTEVNQSGQTLLSQNPTGVKLQRRLIVKHGF